MGTSLLNGTHLNSIETNYVVCPVFAKQHDCGAANVARFESSVPQLQGLFSGSLCISFGFGQVDL